MKIIKKYRQRELWLLKLTTYNPLSIFIRLTLISLIAIGVLNLIVYSVDTPQIARNNVPAKYYITIIIAFIVSGEFQIALDFLLEKLLPVPNKIRLRTAIQFTSAFLVLYITSRIIMLTVDANILDNKNRPAIFIGIIIGLLFVHLIANGLTITRFTEKWLETQKKLAAMKQEKLIMDYNSLQNQLNPHFLFNNLSVLKSLIIYDKDAAISFTENFTDVYRYVLQSKEKKLVEFKEEAKFMDCYLALHKERLGEGLKIQLSIERKALEMKVAPLTLQLLVENAIKHNIASTEKPLCITIGTKEDYLIVENNINPKTTSYSTKTGLLNLVKRYQILTEKEVLISSNKEKFNIKVPLL